MRPGDHAQFLETHGNSVRLGRSAFNDDHDELMITINISIKRERVSEREREREREGERNNEEN